MKEFKGRIVASGTVTAKALVSHGGLNTLASFQKALQFGDKKATCGDQNNPDLYGKQMAGKALCLPTTIGSTTGGLVLYCACSMNRQPACMLFSEPIDSLAAAGAILADVWLDNESSTMTLDAKQVQTMVLDLDCGEVAFVRSNAADEITLRFENFYSDWLERTVDESGFSVRYKIPKGYISGSDPTPTLSIALPEIELEQIELNLNLGSADLGTLKAKSIQADLALGSLYADELQTGQLDATLALGSAELGTVQAERVTIENAQGDVTISRLVGASQVQVTDQLGNIALTLGEKADGYSVQAACGLGSITVSGAKQASPYSANSKAANAVILDAALGDITLNFEE